MVKISREMFVRYFILLLPTSCSSPTRMEQVLQQTSMYYSDKSIRRQEEVEAVALPNGGLSKHNDIVEVGSYSYIRMSNILCKIHWYFYKLCLGDTSWDIYISLGFFVRYSYLIGNNCELIIPHRDSLLDTYISPGFFARYYISWIFFVRYQYIIENVLYLIWIISEILGPNLGVKLYQ